MSPTSPDRIVLTDPQRRELTGLVRAGRTAQRLVVRARIVLLAADGLPNARIAASLDICQDTARTWRHRWCAAPGVSSLGDAKRCGRPAVFTALQVAQVKALACTPPKDCGLPLSKWSCPELAGQVLTVVRFAVDGFIVNEDRNLWRGQRSDGLVGEVTVPGRASADFGRHSDGHRRARQSPTGTRFQLRRGCGGARSRPWAKEPTNAHTGTATPNRSR